MAKLTARFDIQDRISKKLKTIRGEIDSIEKSRQQVNRPITMRVKDEASKVLKKQSNSLKDIAKTHTVTLTAKDKATAVVRRVANYGTTALSKGFSVTVRAVDLATRTIGRIASFANTSIPRVRDFTVRALDSATRVIGTIRRALFSIPSLITVTLAAVGVGKLKDSTIGAAMTFEGYEVAMDHWLNGNKQKSQELINWMGQFADKTPFSSPDLFPALTRGVGITDGNIDEAKKLLTMSADMAALTPGKTPIDAMEALADARIGEFARLTEFNMKVTKQSYKAMGGWNGLMGDVEKKFSGGAEKLSATSAGIIATLGGYRSSIFRSFGTGFLDPMKPRLNAINLWLDNNQDTWAKWKNTVRQSGEQASEWAFSKLETAFHYLKNNYLDNKDFTKLDFEGKIAFILDDINEWWSSKGKPVVTAWWESSGKPWATDTGELIGQAVFNGMVTGIKGGLSSLGDIWKKAFTDPSASSIGGAAVATSLAGMAGSLLLAPMLKPVRGLAKAGKWTYGKTFGRGKARTPIPKASVAPMAEPPVVSTKRKGWLKERLSKRKIRPKRISAAERTRNAQAEMEEARKYSQTPQAYRPPKNAKSMFGITGGASKGLSKIPFLRSGMAVLSLSTASEEDMPGVIGSLAGGFAGAKGGALAGAAIGSVVPGIGTAIGGAAGGIIGGIGGAMGGEWIGNHWDVIKEKASDAASWVGTKFGEAKETLSETIFSGDWWGTKWESVKGTATETIFNGGWWSEQVGFVFGTLESTLFSGDWWGGKWDGVKSWTSEKWNEWNEIYDGAKSKIEETIFSGEWWSGKWSDVKGWAKDITDGFSDSWENAKTKASETLFSSNWWSGKWGSVKSWAQSAWSDIKSGFTIGREEGKQAGSATKYANGGLINRPHLGLVGEAGPEMIIPLSGNRRGRAMDLYQQTGKMLGVRPYADGGFAGSVSSGQMAAINSSKSASSVGGKIRDIIVQITGDNHYADEMDAEKVGQIALEYIRRKLEEEIFTGGDGVYDV
ncbi:hypothetical protein [Sporosarcina sp. Marseille-Q4943]|uniref:hypothetical protein n=1 Tax=Sporosarcina sp. Marseille-Q4943 TaxID=2942204 RepID=UPI00208DB278|nr:hypothetical protein [Sporosarcina sp. Marseille-Q4943]